MGYCYLPWPKIFWSFWLAKKDTGQFEEKNEEYPSAMIEPNEEGEVEEEIRKEIDEGLAKEFEERIDCGVSYSCLEENLKKCRPAVGRTEIKDLALVEFKVIGPTNSSCLAYIEILEIKNLPPELEKVPAFILEPMLKGLSADCLILGGIYPLGLEKTGEYIGRNITTACQGTLSELVEKFRED